MRATALLLSSAALVACGKTETVDLTAKLAISNAPADWCTATNPDKIRMDCPFEVGLYVNEVTAVDAGSESTKVVSTVCVKLDGQVGRTWADLPMALNTNMAALKNIEGGTTVRLSMAIVEPPTIASCDHDTSVAAAAFFGQSNDVALDSNPDPAAPSVKRIDISTKCLKPFTATATCLPP